MPRSCQLIILLCAFIFGSLFGQSYFSPEPTDSPQFTALVLGKPVRVPDDAGGGLIAVGRIAPLSFKFHKNPGTPYLWGFFRVPEQSENWGSEEFYIIAEEKSLKVLAIFSRSRAAYELFANHRMAIAGPAGEQIWNEAGAPPIKSALLATSCPNLFCVTRGSEENNLMRLAPGFERLKDFPLLVGGTFSFELDPRAYADLRTAPVITLPPFVVESSDSPQMLAVIQGKPFPLPASVGSGVVELGKPAPPALTLARIEGTPWCRADVVMPDLDETRPGGSFSFFARSPDGPVEIISAGGFPALLLFESNRLAPPASEALGLATETQPGEVDHRYTLLATRFPDLILASGENFEGFYRLSSGVRLIENLPIGDTVKLSLDLNRAAPRWLAEQEPLLARAWSAAPTGPDWAALTKIQEEATLITGDKVKALQLVTTAGAKLWAALTPSPSAPKGPGQALLKRFGIAALAEPYELEAFREIYAFSQLYPDTRPAGPLTEKLLDRYDSLPLEKLLDHVYFAATEPPALTALRHARRIDSPEATDDDLAAFRNEITHLITLAEAEILLPKDTKIPLRVLTPEQEKALLARIATLTLKTFPAKESSVRWHLDALQNARPSPLRTAAFSLLATLSDTHLVPPGQTELSYTPACAFGNFLSDYDQREKFSSNEQANHVSSLLYRVRHRPLYDALQDTLLATLPRDVLIALVNKSVEHDENARLRERFPARIREFDTALANLERAQAKRGNYALAAVLAVNQAQSSSLPAPADRISLLKLPTDASSENPWERARFYVGQFIAAAYPPLEPSLEESTRLHLALNGSAELAFAPVFRDLGITFGSLTDYALATRDNSKTPLRLALDPARFVPADQAKTSPWHGHEHPLLATRWSDLKVAQGDVASIGKTDEWAARFYGTSNSEQELQNVRARLAEVRGTAQNYQSHVDAAATGLANYEREKAQLERDGIVLGRDPNNADRVVTRDLNSFENRSIATTIDNQKETLQRESEHQNFLNREVAALETRERELSSEISEYRGRANHTSTEYVNSARRDLTAAEEAYRQAWANIGTRPDNGAAAQRNPLRVTALAEYRNSLWSELRDAHGEKETELFWRSWWLSRTRDPRAESKPPDLGGARFPTPVARPDAVDPIWRFEFEQALGVEERDDAVRHFLYGTAALASALPVKPELLEELKAACQRLTEHDKYLPERVLYEASRYQDRTCYQLLDSFLK